MLCSKRPKRRTWPGDGDCMDRTRQWLSQEEAVAATVVRLELGWLRMGGWAWTMVRVFWLL